MLARHAQGRPARCSCTRFLELVEEHLAHSRMNNLSAGVEGEQHIRGADLADRNCCPVRAENRRVRQETTFVMHDHPVADVGASGEHEQVERRPAGPNASHRIYWRGFDGIAAPTGKAYRPAGGWPLCERAPRPICTGCSPVARNASACHCNLEAAHPPPPRAPRQVEALYGHRPGRSINERSLLQTTAAAAPQAVQTAIKTGRRANVRRVLMRTFWKRVPGMAITILCEVYLPAGAAAQYNTTMIPAEHRRGDDNAHADNARADDPAKISRPRRHSRARFPCLRRMLGVIRWISRGKDSDAGNIRAMPTSPPSAENTTAQDIFYATHSCFSCLVVTAER